MSTAPESTRSRFTGVTQIVRFNWPFYVFAILAVLATLWAPWPWPVAGAVALFYLLVSLSVSHYVYDLSSLYRWDWLDRAVPSDVQAITNVHAGLDETSRPLAFHFPQAQLTVLDVYDPETHTEASIRRARAARPPLPETVSTPTDDLPLADHSQDAVFLILAIHEIREEAEAVSFFQEVRRILAEDGRAVLVEHLRDPANFLAFGPGSFHFFSRRRWLRVIEQGGLEVTDEFAVNPFVRAFVLIQPEGSA